MALDPSDPRFAQFKGQKQYDPGVFQQGNVYSTLDDQGKAVSTTREDWIKAHPGDTDVFDIGGAGAKSRAKPAAPPPVSSSPPVQAAPNPTPQDVPASSAPPSDTAAPVAAPPPAAPPPTPGVGWATVGPGSLNPNLGKMLPRADSMKALATLGKGAY